MSAQFLPSDKLETKNLKNWTIEFYESKCAHKLNKNNNNNDYNQIWKLKKALWHSEFVKFRQKLIMYLLFALSYYKYSRSSLKITFSAMSPEQNDKLFT